MRPASNASRPIPSSSGHRCSPTSSSPSSSEHLIEILRQGHLVRNFYILYGMLDHARFYFAAGAGAHLFMIPVDCVVAGRPRSPTWRTTGTRACEGAVAAICRGDRDVPAGDRWALCRRWADPDLDL